MKLLVLFYSTYGHMYQMAEAAAEGARAAGADVTLKRVPETIPDEVLAQIGAKDAQKAFAHVPVATPDELGDYDAIIVGTSTRFGNMAGQMRNFLDQTGSLWASGKLVGKVGSVMSSTATQHGGQEMAIITTQITLMHQGMVIVGLPYSFPGQSRLDEIVGGSPYGATTIAGTDGSRLPSETDLEGARFQGRHVAEIAQKLAG